VKGVLVTILMCLGLAVSACAPVEDTELSKDATADSETTTSTGTTSNESSDKAITAFLFEASKNDQLVDDATADFDGNDIIVIVPYDTDVSNLIASFSFVGKKVKTTSTQVSGLTQNNFEEPLTYKAIAEDDSVRIYQVAVTPAAGFYTSELTGSITEAGGSATFVVKLKREPTEDVTIALSSSDTTEVTLTPET